MIGALIAGGASTRLPGKLAARVGGRTLVEHGSDLLRELGCQRVLVVTRAECAAELLGVAPRVSQVAIIVQPDDAQRGIATAVATLQPWIGAEPLVVLLADNLFGLAELPWGWPGRSASQTLRHDLLGSGAAATILVREDQRAVEHTVVRFSPAGDIESIEEKPGRAPREGDHVMVGLYAYRGPAIFRAIARCVPSPRGEVEIADAHRMLWQQGDLAVQRIRGPWTDVNTPEALAAAEQEDTWI